MTADSESDIRSLQAIGRGLHEAPGEIWNFSNPGDHCILKNGAVLAIELF